MAHENATHTEKGAGLARGPALVLGTILLAAGLYLLYKQNDFPPLSQFPDGSAKPDGKVFFGIFGANGWTGMFTAIAGGLLLFGAAQHLLAKTMSLVVGLALAACALIALVSGDGVLGLAAANGATELAWAIAAVILLFNTLAPRRKKTVVDDPPRQPVDARRTPRDEQRVAAPAAGARASRLPTDR
ncbi:hypothetical protein Q5424_11550 [Conexibacter sp. JD483]|uniref:hypothetical protein n=1 Tax=unclassified Conexibacter TaxID=2627773 RepID=UPI00271CEBF8|nr:MULTISPECIES: hypothetical protein [unclassified Conexibacter]MDO8187956.1 hypothetical protein [Conexibacter sp. CPCC 205706]MDO8200175.1 hypothetical protein [Conexibacter sp. CPCC 205762]MDR9369721.1 hypothetical protein [Conexibacter sp. JD483]